MDDAPRAQNDASLGLLDDLTRRGREIKATLDVDVIRERQRDCAAAINHLSGGEGLIGCGCVRLPAVAAATVTFRTPRGASATRRFLNATRRSCGRSCPS